MTLDKPYHNSDNEEFPIANYLHKETGKLVDRYQTYKDYSINHEEFEKFVDKWKLNNIHSYVWIQSKQSDGEIRTYEYIDRKSNIGIRSGRLILKISPYKIKKKKSKSDDDDDWEEPESPNITIYSAGMLQSKFDEICNDLLKTLRKTSIKENNISLIIKARHGYDTQTFDLPKQKLELNLNYGESFIPVHDKIINELNKKDGKGLVLLHGEPGCGKTHYLKYLASKVKNKKVMFVPPHMVDFITSPEMAPFLIDNSNSILFIEDAERVITDRDQNNNAGVSNILNLTDGILGDILKIQIVATFNMDRRKIDTALLRKGRLIAEHKFDKLPVDDANKLIKHLGMEHIATEPMTLTEIYNLQEVEYKVEEPKRKIGF